jgi:hypothetical protein
VLREQIGEPAQLAEFQRCFNCVHRHRKLSVMQLMSGTKGKQSNGNDEGQQVAARCYFGVDD